MKIKHKNQKTKKKVITLLLVIILISVFGVWIVWYAGFLKLPTKDISASQLEKRTLNGTSYSQPTEEQKNGGGSIKENPTNQNKEPQSSTNNLTIDLVAFQKSNGEVHINANIRDFVTSSGSCKMSISQGAVTKTYEADIVAIAGYSTCKGFDVPNLTSGTWQVSVNVSSGEHSGNSTTSVEVKA